MALTNQQREDVFRYIESEASAGRSGQLLRQLYDLIFATNVERLAAVRTFLDELIAKANAAITAHDSGAAQGKADMEAKRDALTTLRNSV